MAKQKRIRVVYMKLGRRKIWGHADNYPLELDERLKGKKHCEILLHECLHYLWPHATEEEVERKAILLTNTMWHEGYRKIDQSKSEPLQDGTQ